MATPIGMIEVCGDADALLSVTISADSASAVDADPASTPPSIAGGPVAQAISQLSEYFARRRHCFDLPLHNSSTPRGQALRDGISSIAYGQTLSYGALARQLASGPRAVGQACRRNPFPIIVPCHRVTSASGPEHYSGGAGIDTKAWLNAFERGEISI